MSEQYPFVKYPRRIELAKQFIPSKPIKPNPPQELQITHPKRISFEGVSYGCLPGWGIAILIGFFTNNLNLAFIALLVAPFLVSYLTYNSRVVRYKESQEKNRKEKEKFTKDNEVYNTEIVQYQALINDKQRIKKLQIEKVKESSEFTEPPDGENSTARKGYSEDTFSKYLLQCFPGKIYQGLSLEIPNYEYPYTPDFCYIHDQLHIDIEIDEPYAFQSKDPCHYIESERDKNRDSFFLNKNWIVIRFSEEQIHCHPLKCCRFIFDVVDDLIGVEIPELLKNIESVEPQQRWSESEAQQMANTNYRNSYLR